MFPSWSPQKPFRKWPGEPPLYDLGVSHTVDLTLKCSHNDSHLTLWAFLIFSTCSIYNQPNRKMRTSKALGLGREDGPCYSLGLQCPSPKAHMQQAWSPACGILRDGRTFTSWSLVGHLGSLVAWPWGGLWDPWPSLPLSFTLSHEAHGLPLPLCPTMMLCLPQAQKQWHQP
jgi:hypothetical protein